MIGMRAGTPDYCATGITANQNTSCNAPPARLRVSLDSECRHPPKQGKAVVASSHVGRERAQKFGLVSEPAGIKAAAHP